MSASDDTHRSEQTALIAALVEARKGFAAISKDGYGSHLKNHYATLGSVLDAVTGPLLEQGIVISQSPVPIGEGEWALRTALCHVEGGELVGLVPLDHGRLDEHGHRQPAPGLNPMQSLGSAITYARRYGILSLLCLATEDDDGASAPVYSQPQRREQEAPRSRQAPRNGSKPDRPEPTPQELRGRQDAALKRLWDDPPRDGRGLFGMVKDLDPQQRLMKAVNAFGKGNGWAFKMTEWSAPHVLEAVRFIRDEMEAASIADKEAN